MLDHIDDTLMLESYYKAVELNLSQDFITILRNELERREIQIAAPEEICI
ncbi:sporulation histidine kinase inhibitor Sda [Alkalihalobacillus oceani]|nr:sporulation histidine kinase inhibitor Sda [Halalkalibacter oceani]MCM3761153.1 sporulation histidine kinase inhibitor Sda [Halalkalibacter oceani]